MNRAQLVIMWAAIALIVLAIVYPPWSLQQNGMTYNLGYACLFGGSHKFSYGSPDLVRVGLEIIAILVVAAGAMVTTGRARPKAD